MKSKPTSMKPFLIILISLGTITAFGQQPEYPDSGFTNKAEAKNLYKDSLKEGKWVEYWESYKVDNKKDSGVAIPANSIKYSSYSVKNGVVNISNSIIAYRYTTDTNAPEYFLTIYKEGKPYGVIRKYYKSGKLSEIIPTVNGKINGNVKQYYESGRLGTETMINEGKRNGLERVYYENGDLKSEDDFINGRIDGVSKFYYENGRLVLTPHTNGTIDGVVKAYYESGELWQETPWVNGKMN